MARKGIAQVPPPGGKGGDIKGGDIEQFDKGWGNDFEEPTKDTIDKWKRTLEESGPIIRNIVKQRGIGPGLGTFILELLEKEHQPQLDWKSIIQSAVDKACGPHHYTFDRPSRRFTSSGPYIPARVKEPSPCEIAVGVDVSGSMSNDDIVAALSEIDNITEDYPNIKKEISWVSTAMDGPYELEGKYADNPIPIRTTGGTELSPFFEYYAKHDGEKSKKRVTVMFTDLDTNLNIIKKIVEDSGMQNIFFITNVKGAKAPVGETMEYSP